METAAVAGRFVDLAMPVADVRKLAALSEVLTIQPEQIESIVHFQSYVVTDAGPSPFPRGQVMDEHGFRAAVNAVGRTFKAGMGAESVRVLLEPGEAPGAILERIPDVRAQLAGQLPELHIAYDQLLEANETLMLLLQMRSPEVIVRSKRARLQRTADSLLAALERAGFET